jgi:hypothetical protein
MILFFLRAETPIPRPDKRGISRRAAQFEYSFPDYA